MPKSVALNRIPAARVIDHDNRFRGDLTHGGDYRRHIVHFHGDRAGRFEEHHAGLRANQTGDIGTD